MALQRRLIVKATEKYFVSLCVYFYRDGIRRSQTSGNIDNLRAIGGKATEKSKRFLPLKNMIYSVLSGAYIYKCMYIL